MKKSLLAVIVSFVLLSVFTAGMSGCGEKYPSHPINEKRGAGTADDEDNYEDAEPEFGE